VEEPISPRSDYRSVARGWGKSYVASHTNRSRGWRQYLPLIYVGLALIVSGLVLPSALRPPPNPAQTSNALDPNAPPNQNNPNRILESLQEAGGGGAGAGAGVGSGSTTTTTIPRQTRKTPPTTVAAPPLTVPERASLAYCYGNPPRQIPSIYAGPCVGAWQGNNGGATAFNVFPNEVRVAVQNSSLPSGPLPDPSTDNASTSSTIETWQALQEYFNAHYQFYGRKLVFYGAPNPSQSTQDSYSANATLLAQTYHVFAQYNAQGDVCIDAAEQGVVSFCNPLPHQEYVDHAPYLYTYNQMDLSELMSFGSEFACKALVGRTAQWAGVGSVGKPRKFGFVTFEGLDGGIPGSAFSTAFSSECHGQVETATLNGDEDVQGATAAIAKFEADGVTTILFTPGDINAVLLMEDASKAAYFPEWVVLGSYILDENTIGELFPTDESDHLFGISSLEWAQNFADTECAQAVESVDPSLSPNSTVCVVYWQWLVWLANGLQGAGPDLAPANFQKAEYAVGFRFNLTSWMEGGGYGPGEYAFPHSVGYIWFNPAAQDPITGAPGAYEWIYGGKRFQLGQLPSDVSQLFSSGSAVAPASCAPSSPPC
jgi:hypothetical protein